jgi:hypothetical protein
MDKRALLVATTAGAALQLAMVAAGHTNGAVAALFAVGGMGFSLAAGVLYALTAKTSPRSSSLGGAVAGGLCAFVGIAVSLVLGDVVPMLLVMGTLSSAVTGAVGGAVGGLLFRRAGQKP